MSGRKKNSGRRLKCSFPFTKTTSDNISQYKAKGRDRCAETNTTMMVEEEATETEESRRETKRPRQRKEKAGG